MKISKHKEEEREKKCRVRDSNELRERVYEREKNKSKMCREERRRTEIENREFYRSEK